MKKKMKKMNTMTREEVKRVIEGRGQGLPVPLMYDFWIGKNVFGDEEERRKKWMVQYPRDINAAFIGMPGIVEGKPQDSDYFWAAPGKKAQPDMGIDARCYLEDWEELNEVLETFPNVESPAMFTNECRKDDRYLLGVWWGCYFEWLWSLRGMENALTDFLLYPKEIHRLFSRLTDFYVRMLERVKETWDVDGFFVSDDLGTQTGPFFSVEIFREFFKPFYKRIIDKAHELGCHFWLHSCGNIENFLPEFIEIGLDVIHPIQKNTMDERQIAEQFGGQICILSGIDVQYLFAFGTPDEVRTEVRHLMETYYRPEGRLMMNMGNASTPDWKVENLDALYEESMAFNENLMKNLRKQEDK